MTFTLLQSANYCYTSVWSLNKIYCKGLEGMHLKDIQVHVWQGTKNVDGFTESDRKRDIVLTPKPSILPILHITFYHQFCKINILCKSKTTQDLYFVLSGVEHGVEHD